jgi:hypothetical protein
MAKFKIEQLNGYDYITHLGHNFTLKVIPPEKQPEGYELGRQVVGASLTVLSDYLLFGVDNKSYDFESLDNGFYEDNKIIWYETIDYYCKLVLDIVPENFTIYNYEEDLTEENCSPECWAALHGSTDIKSKTIEFPGKAIKIIPNFDRIEEAMEEGVLTYHLYNVSEEDIDNFYFGKMLFDLEDNWIYEGETFSPIEQEKVADFILNDVV